MDQDAIQHARELAQELMEITGPDEALPTEAKLYALQVAAHMGPDYAQALYRFAVLVTKLA